MGDELTPSADGHYLRALLDKPFTDRQLEIVTAGLQPQLVIAGAGSGKTTVMAARIVHAVAWHHVRPDGILGLTFTNKAASELAERVRDALARLSRLGPSGELMPVSLHQPEPDDQPTVSTYHAYAASLIKDHALRIGREPDSRLLTEAGRWQLALRVVRAAPGPYETWTWMPPTVAERMLDLDGEMAEHLRLPGDVRAFDARTIASAAAVTGGVKALREIGEQCKVRDELLDLVDRYRARKAELDLVDFGDQVALAAEIAQSCPEVGASERERFPLVFLDEYQDTGVAQRILLSHLFSGAHPVTAVGDPCQSIYGWRGASIGNLLRFSEHFPSPDGTDPLYLLTSFRNGSHILDAANAVSETLRAEQPLGRRPYVEVPPLEPGRSVPGHVRTALHTTVVDEVEWLADRLEECIAAGTAPAEIAVLCRRRSDFALIHRSLAERAIPVEVVGLGGLLEMPEVADVVAVLEVMAEPTANPALVRILTGPRYRIGPRDLKALGRRAAFLARDALADRSVADPDGNRALAQAAASVDDVDVVALTDALDSLGDPTAYSAEGYARLVELRAELTRFRSLLSQPIVEAVVGVVGAIGLDVEIEASPAGLAAARAANLSAFLDHAARFEGIEGESDLAAFLAYLVAAGDKERGLDIGGVSAADTIKLMTVHKAKGLEWSVVALPGLVDEIFPSNRGRSRWTRRADALPYELRGDADDLPAFEAWTSQGLKEFDAACAEQDDEEERRLAYVAITRARDLLLASGYVWNDSRKKSCKQSDFLVELRAAVPPDPLWDDPWDEAPGEENPLTAFGVPDVGWPPAYRPGPLERRRSAAELVQKAGSGASDGSPADPLWAPEIAAWDREVGQLLDELAAGRAPVRDVLLPRTLSASQVVALAQDPEEFARALARPMPRRPSTAARRGTAFHAWVEHLFDAKPLFDTDDLEGAADDEWPDDVQAPEEELAEQQAAFARTAYGDLTPYAVEAPFELVIGGRLLRGRIDAVYRTDAGFDVVDYKTGLRPGKPQAAALQLAIYRLAWAGIAGVPVESVGAAFLYVRTGDLVRPELAGADEIAALLSDDAEAPEAALPSPPALDAVSVATALAPAPGPAPPPVDQDDGQLTLDWS
ncbi:MAG: ATP-dependent helicase UvrD/PcrA [Frankiales bacterium]|nr:ATP-dependent helicase UvrD/PcrA [Frankiales bacterium]